MVLSARCSYLGIILIVYHLLIAPKERSVWSLDIKRHKSQQQTEIEVFSLELSPLLRGIDSQKGRGITTWGSGNVDTAAQMGQEWRACSRRRGLLVANKVRKIRKYDYWKRRGESVVLDVIEGEVEGKGRRGRRPTEWIHNIGEWRDVYGLVYGELNWAFFLHGQPVAYSQNSKICAP